MKRGTIPDPRTLRKDLARPPRYEALKRRCEAKVVRWVWATGPLHERRTFEADIDGSSRGKALAKAPKRKQGLEQYGFDSGGELMVHRSWTDLPNRCYETLFAVRAGGAVDGWYFHYSPAMKASPRRLDRYWYEEGRLVADAGLTEEGYGVAHAYRYEDGRVREIRARTVRPASSSRYALRWVGQELARIERMGRRGSEIVYQRPTRSLPAVLSSLRRRLLKEVPEVVRRGAPKAAVFCLALVYDAESYEGMMPTLALGTRGDLERWERDGARKRKPRELWDPQGFASFLSDALELEDPALVSDGQAMVDLLREAGKTQAARKLLIDVARALNRLPWPRRLRVESPFLVYPADLEGAHLLANIRAAAPAATLQRLRSLGRL